MATRPALRLLILLLAVAAIVGAAAIYLRAARLPQGNLSGAAIGGEFALVDETGAPVSWSGFDGQWRLVYFGFTFCPDVCPVSTANLGAGLARFEAEHPRRGAIVLPLFVTVDPERDTPQVLAEFTSHFHPRLLGLTGTPDAVAAALKAFRVYARRQEGATDGSYLVDHSDAIYLFDTAGRPVAFLPGPESSPEAVAALLDTHVR
ncbi:MAG: SCO family protein [Sphingomonadaceae bacterium]